MTSIYDFDKLAKLLNSLYLLTGRKITLKDSDFNNVITSNTACEFCRLIQSTPFGYEKCLACDTEALAYAKRQNKAYLYRCHAGLMEAAVPAAGLPHVWAGPGRVPAGGAVGADQTTMCLA